MFRHGNAPVDCRLAVGALELFFRLLLLQHCLRCRRASWVSVRGVHQNGGPAAGHYLHRATAVCRGACLRGGRKRNAATNAD